MEAVLDSSFILSCARRKIDFISQLQELGFKATIPREVLQELKDLRLKVKRDDRVAIDFTLGVLQEKAIKKVGFGSGKVDEQLIKMGREGFYIATLDNAIKRAVPNRIVISNAQNKVMVERD